jgi:phage-related protein
VHLLQERHRKEPVRDWLKTNIPTEARKTIGADIKTVQATWPIDRPLVASLGLGLREVRSIHDKIEYRVIFLVDGDAMVLLHSFVKATKRTKKADIAIALNRKAAREKSR